MALTPLMGWNTYGSFGCNISETLVTETAAAMVARGFAAAGYTFVTVDDCWSSGRDQNGLLIADRKTFPSGMAALGATIHSMGLEFGIYGCSGLLTCERRPGSKGYEQLDARTFAAWGVDMLKYDNCYPDNERDVNGNSNMYARARYATMRNALGDGIRLSVCEWGCNSPWEWAPTMASSWRTGSDIAPSWRHILRSIDSNAPAWAAARPGAFNDPDMMEVGVGALTPAQERSHFSAWVVMKAPLVMGCDVRTVSAESAALLTNAEAISINQDDLGLQAYRSHREPGLDVWAGPLTGGRAVVLLLNRGETDFPVNLTWGQMGVVAGGPVRDVWANSTMDATWGINATLPPFDCIMLSVENASLTGSRFDEVPRANTRPECFGPKEFPIIVVILVASAVAILCCVCLFNRRWKKPKHHLLVRVEF
jgi:alpha-galactosidase